MPIGTRRMRVAVLDFFFGGIAHFADAHIEMQFLTSHWVIQVHVDRTHPDLVHGHRTLTAFLQLKSGRHAWLEAIRLREILL